MVARRLDHVIVEVADIATAHRRLVAAGYPEAWPVGAFWPAALTSGVCVGAFNVELYQSIEAPRFGGVTTLVLEPTSVADAAKAMDGVGQEFEIRDKIEGDSTLLRLRGFDGRQPERICTNLLPVNSALPFFFCDYAPFLRQRLDPAGFSVADSVKVERIDFAYSPSADRLVGVLGSEIPGLRFVPASRTGSAVFVGGDPIAIIRG